MNAIQQISLKLQMGIHPATEVQPELLRAMWRELSRQRYKVLEAGTSDDEFSSSSTLHPTVRRTG